MWTSVRRRCTFVLHSLRFFVPLFPSLVHLSGQDGENEGGPSLLVLSKTGYISISTYLSMRKSFRLVAIEYSISQHSWTGKYETTYEEGKPSFLKIETEKHVIVYNGFSTGLTLFLSPKGGRT